MTPEEQAAIRAAGEVETEIAGGAAKPGPGAPAGAPPAPDDGGKAAKLAELKAENMGLLEMALTLLEPALPFIRQCYTPAACEKIAEAGAAVEEKYGVSIGDLFGKFQPEIMLAVAVVVPTFQAVRMTRELIAAKRAAAPPAAEKTPPGGSAVVVPINPAGGGDGKKPPAS